MSGFNIGSVYAKLEADITDFKKGMSEAENRVNSLGSTMQNVGGKIADFGKQAAIMTGVIAAGVGLVGKNAIDVAGQLEQTQIAFNTLLKDEKKTTEAIAAIKKDAAKSTLFGFNDLAKANQLLISAGENTDSARTNINALSDAIAATDGGNAELSRLAVNLQQIKAVGQASQLDIKQFAFAGINIYKLLSDETGKSVEQVKEMDITYELLTKAIQRSTKAGGMFEGAAEAQSKSLKGLYEGLKDNINLTLADIAVKSGLFDVIKSGLQGVAATFDSLAPKITRFFSVLGGTVDLLVLVGSDKSAIGEVREFISYFMGGQMPDENHPAVLFFIKFADVLTQMGAWISENNELVMTFLQGLAIGLGALLIVGTITALLTALLNPMVLVVFAIAALYTAWQTNFWGIRDITTAVVNEIVNFWNNYLKPAMDVLVGWWQEHSQSIIAVLQSAWALITAIFTTSFEVLYGLIKLFLALFAGDWGKAWEALKQLTVDAFSGIYQIYRGAVDTLRNIGNLIFEAIKEPFEKAWNTVKEKMNQIKDAVDFTKRHSPSVVDIVNKGVSAVNSAMSNLDLGVSATVNSATLPASQITGRNAIIGVNISLDGAVIADQAGAMRISEVIGDGIIRKLQHNLRF